MTKRFHVGDLLSVMTDRLHGPHQMDGVCSLLSHLAGERLMTHQLPRAARAVKGFLVATFPDLPTEGYHPDLAATDDWRDVPVPPASSYQPMNPIEELIGTVGEQKAIVVNIGDSN